MSKKIFFLSVAFLLFFAVLPQLSFAVDETTLQCSGHLLGTSSKEDCSASCKPPLKCAKINSFKGQDNKTVDCFACAGDNQCSDMGYLDLWGCWGCDMNPATECIKAGLAIPGFLPGGGGLVGGKTLMGTQCYKCVAKPDRCNQQWPGTSWLAACQANCAAPKQCIQVGIFEGNACFQCVDAPKTCADMGLLTGAQCGPCNANPNTECKQWGFDAKMQACFKCVPKAKLPEPPPPPKTCHEHGLLNNCDVCAIQGKDCEFVKVNDKLTCARCLEKEEVRDCKPYLNVWDCPNCEAEGGQCIAMTKVRGDPTCYYCYKPSREKPKGCSKYGLPYSCNPNPCFEGEACMMISPELGLYCATCIPKETEEKNLCAELLMEENCAVCYRSQHACREVWIPEKKRYCAECYRPQEPQDCEDLELPNSCTPDPCEKDEYCAMMPFGETLSCPQCYPITKCPDGYFPEKCSETACDSQHTCMQQGDCHKCVPKKEICENAMGAGYFSSEAACQAACESEDKMCQASAGLDGGQICWSCVEKPKTQPCPYGFDSGACTQTTCDSQHECVEESNCHFCREKWNEKTCAEQGLQNYYDCYKSCVENGGTCKATGKDSTGTMCYACEGARTTPQCEQGFASGACTSSSCSSEEECVTDGNCHQCKPKEKYPSCEDVNMIATCRPDPCPEGQICQFTDAPNGLRCAQCVSTSTVQCPQGASAGRCAPSPCHYDENCKELSVGPGPCYTCEKSAFACNTGLTPGSCPGSCNAETQECVEPVWNKGCHYCQSKPVTTDCSQGASPGACTSSSCSQGESCLTVDGNCHVCQRRPPSCHERGLLLAFDCDTCMRDDKECFMTSERDSIGPCYGCKEKSRTSDLCPEGTSPGACNAYACDSNQECVAAGNNCHTCKEKKKDKTCGDVGLMDFEGCQFSCLGGGGEFGMSGPSAGGNVCVEAPVAGVNDRCYVCRKKGAATACDQGMTPGSCPGSCDYETQECFESQGPCHGCKEKPKTCAKYELLDSCYPCMWQKKKCVDVSPAPGLNCKECVPWPCDDYYTQDECWKCHEDDADCVPVHRVRGKDGEPIQCFECVDEAECSDYGLVCSCASCRPGTLCVRAPIYGMPCYACLKNVTIQVTYAVYVIETPRGRFILKDSGEGMSRFTPSSIMALAKIDTSQLDAVKQMAGLVKGGKFSLGSLQDISGMLSKNLGSKGAKYNDNCFGNFSEPDMPKTPPSSGGGKTGGAPSAGKNEAKDKPVDGPIVACGKQNGKDVLSVFDAGGTPVQTILKEELMKNPNMLTESLLKAEELSQKLDYVRNLTPQQLAKSAANAVIDKIFSPRSSKEGEGKPTATDPNDPLYMYKEGKQSKLFGILGSSTKPSKVIIGSSMPGIGSGVGGGSGGDDEDEQSSKIKDQWGLQKIGFAPKSDPNSAWNVVDAQKQNVVVAIIDSGFDLTHPDGPTYVWRNSGEIGDNRIDDDNNGLVDDVYGWNFLDNNNNLKDEKGHGTFVAGIIAAKMNNGIGIAGINPGAVIMPLKVADAEGQTNSLHIFQAVNYAVAHGARVINISMGGRGVSKLEQVAIEFARSKGVFVAVAAGNVGENIMEHGPASSGGAVAVGSIDYDGARSTISNAGANNGLMAPGESIYSLRSIDSYNPKSTPKATKYYYKQSGTSFSTPMVAATASLLLAKNPNLTNSEIEDILQATATNMYEEGWDGQSGAGLLNAAKALRTNPDHLLTVKVTKLQPNWKEKGKLESIDIYGTVRGDVDSFVVELGKGKHPGRFKPVTGAFTAPAENAWVAQISEDEFRGSKDWVIQINAKGKDGKNHTAQVDFNLK